MTAPQPPAEPDETPTRTRRNSLSRPVLLAAAMHIVEVGGVAGLSMRALGARLDVDPTAVYRHFRNKNELLDTLADTVIRGETALPQDGEPLADARECFRRLRRSILERPSLASLVPRRPPDSEPFWELGNHVVGLLRQDGRPLAEAATLQRTALLFTLGEALSAARLLAAAIAKDGPDATVAPGPRPPAGRYPHLAAAGAYPGPDAAARFEAGLAVILTDPAT
jgi:TetR/AcrR family transcriptional regulator, tetracycline repressor protein